MAEFEENLAATDTGLAVEAVGYETSTSSNIASTSSLADTLPIATYVSSDGQYDYLTFTYSGYEDHYLYSVLLAESS